MGLLDILNGMANGPRGIPNPRDPRSGGMSKMSMAVMAFLAYKAYRNWSGQQQQPERGRIDRDERAGDDRYADARDARGSGSSGGLGDMLRDLLGGGTRRSDVLRRGVDHTVEDFDRAGHGDVARSWVGRGDNRDISREQLESALGEDAIRDLTRQTGMNRDELIGALREHLPRVIDELTPEGRVPNREEAGRLWDRRT